MAKNYKIVSEVVSGSFDGQIILWDLAKRIPIFNINSKHEYVKGLSFGRSGNEFLSIGEDLKINLWNKSLLFEQQSELLGTSNSKGNVNNLELGTSSNRINESYSYTPKHTFNSDSALDSIDHSYSQDQFATAGGVVALWDYNRNKPLTSFKNSGDGFIKVKYNFVEENILLATGIDRSISIYDSRIQTPTHSVSLNNKSSAACWNPQEPFTFTLGNEDSNLYTFDTRRLDKVKTIHKDHLLAVLDVDYSPTGKEFVTGSFDKTIRIFESNEGRSREAYYNKRMQKVYSVLYSLDDNYVYSGSDDTNIRCWKSEASKPNKITSVRESTAINYRKKLLEKYKYNPDVKRIIRKRNLPKYVVNKQKVRHIQKESKYKKTRNVEMNSRPGTVEYSMEKKDKIVKSGVIEN
eukprot:CAMPEP_0170516146 /NCGR_PEP_ID=MMETSP0209-20121228/2457_1 /TAXON_ID=665100 ORGANISM="Litonotus pictus, Strain P1" /NCGR_SAMPLE_ID=MMETSP0209 /ASSEMBLY_ACC=CAM_ASM_000301 /LENGTH=406 /DNA_ID=CAMNT_0010800941 /DNA_START=214 /DNA_END=1434 /DNA_ORIENTATION=+